MHRHPDTEGGRQLRRRALRPCLHGHSRAKELGLSPTQLSLVFAIQEITGCFVANATQHDEKMQHDGEKLHGERNRHVGRNSAFILSRS